MTQLGQLVFGVTGDVGGAGISRMHFQRNDLGTITSADAGTAAAAWRALWQAVHTEMPFGMTVALEGSCEVKDSATGAPVGSVNPSSVPSTVTGSSTGHYAAGNGARVNWVTSTVVNRRLVRGATFLVPLTVDAFSAAGQLNSVQQSSYTTAAAAVITAMSAGSLQLVAWHRPKKGTFVGGVAAAVTGLNVNFTGAMLKSRRT